MIEAYYLEKIELPKILQHLAELTAFEGGRNLAVSLHPIQDMESLLAALAETGEAMELLRYNSPVFMQGLTVITTELVKSRIGSLLSPLEIMRVGKLLRASRLAVSYLKNVPHYRLHQQISLLTILPDLEKAIYNALTEDGRVQDQASPTLRRIRRDKNTVAARIRSHLNDFLRLAHSKGWLQDNIITERSGRYVLPVKQEYRSEVSGIIHDESGSGATLFIEPLAVVEQNNQLRRLEIDEQKEIETILTELSKNIADHADDLDYNLHILSRFDLAIAKAHLAYELDAYKPELNQQGIIELRKARHPLLGDKAVPINVNLGQKFDLLVITGPNTGGKTVVLKTLGLLTVMAMCGLFIPAEENSRIALCNQLYVDIGDEQSIEQSLSTFSAHMKNIVHIVDKVDKHSLVLLDELGSGTDPIEGAALARAVLQHLQDKNARAVVTTHQGELKTYAYQHPRAENASVEFDPVTLKPTYKLNIGIPGQSNALIIAERLGMPEDLINIAHRYVPRRDLEIGSLLRDLMTKKKNTEKLQNDLEQQQMLWEKKRLEIEKEKQAALEERQRILLAAQEKADRYLRDTRQTADQILAQMKQAIKQQVAQPLKWHELDEQRQRAKDLSAPPLVAMQKTGKGQLKQGDQVYIDSLKQYGTIISQLNDKEDFRVAVGAMQLTLNYKNMVKAKPNKAAASPPAAAPYPRNSFLHKTQTITNELDLRGERAYDAVMELDLFLADASLAGLEGIRIIHGKGTGALRQAIHEYLKTQTWIKRYYQPGPEEGGHGVTIVEFK